MRLEMVPFGVKVVSMSTGAVRSQGQTYFGDFALPSSSEYKEIEGIIANRAQGGDGRPRMDAKTYAERVARDILGGVTGIVWHGASATGARIGQFLPTSMMDAGVVKDTGLDIMAQVVAKRS
ncbi:MAG: hypothetical protein MMC23_000626 [Stictis urceolatum]|nr:hypothetical protein [Stictis urceolata]